TTRWCRASTRSSRWTSTSPGARHARKGCCTACSCCTRRSKASRCSTASRVARSSRSTTAACDSPPSRSTRSRSRSATPSTSSARREPHRRRPASDLRQRDRPRARVVRRHHRLYRARSPARRDDLAARRSAARLRLPGRCHGGRVPRPRARARAGLRAAIPHAPRRAGAAGARRQPRSALLDGRVVDRRGVRRAPRRHERAAAPGRAWQAPRLRMSKRTVELELATPGLDDRGQPVRVPLGVADAPDSTPAEPDLAGEHMLINLGPQHPATHGVLRLVVELDGETVVRVIPHLGYLHSGFEKLGEYRHYNQIIPLTDRTDYLSPMANNVGFALAAEKLMGTEITPRCKVL